MTRTNALRTTGAHDILWILMLLMAAGFAPTTSAQVHPMIGKEAPELQVDDWYNLDDGQRIPRLREYKNKVVYIFCYQSWCPGCHKHGFPALRKISDAFTGNDDIVFLVVQTVFEGYGVNTAKSISKTTEAYNLNLPFGHDDGNGKGSTLMRLYKTRGTPWHIIIDRNGKIVFCDFHVDPDKTIRHLRKMLTDADD